MTCSVCRGRIELTPYGWGHNPRQPIDLHRKPHRARPSLLGHLRGAQTT